MTTKEVYNHLRNYYQERVYYYVENTYCFHSYYKETDLLLVQNNRYCVEYEVKSSRADFFADRKKIHKHSILKNGYFTVDYKYGGKYEINEPIYTNNRPNKFFYCCPENLIKINEIPDYAGLIYVLESGEIKKIREAKFLHKEIIDIEPILCRKFYYSYLQQKQISPKD